MNWLSKVLRIVVHGIYAIALGLNGSDTMQLFPLVGKHAPIHYVEV
jgi:hypothetical protein